MQRISTDMPNTDLQYRLRRHEESISKMEQKMGSQKKIVELRDDPLAASHAVRYESYKARLERFEKNTLFAQGHYDMQYAYMNEANDVLQRMRELAVQGGNGTYAPEDLRNMASEVNELIKELVALSNTTGIDGKQLFAGDKAFTEPFRIIEGTAEGGGESMVVQVEYRGAGASRRTEVSDRTFTELDIGGGEAFWAEKMQIFSTIDGSEYRAETAGSFYLDGVEINVAVGDTLPGIVAKINDSPAPVKAYIDPQSRGLVLEGTTAHLIQAEDRVGADGTAESGAHVLRDLGIIQGNMANNAPNWSNSARVYGGSVFDMAIRLRDALYRGDQDFIGSQGIGGMDLAMGNVQARMAQVGSRQERAQMIWSRINQEVTFVQENINRETGLDVATAARELASLWQSQQASLQMAGRILPQTLLDFLR